MKKIVFEEEKCAGCNICSIACMDQNDYDPACGAEPFRNSGCVLKDGKYRNWSTACVHCGLCIDVCPFTCISRDEQTGMVIVDDTDCVGCGACANECPVSAPKIVDGKMRKCDGCNERIKAGMLPACVRACPTGALSFE